MIIDNYQEETSFHVVGIPDLPLILCNTWFNQHNPNIRLCSGTILGWCTTCLTSCFRFTPVSPSNIAEEDPDFPDLSKVPSVYLDLKEVFNKSWATSLPPHCPYDYTIDLLPGTMSPRGRLHSLPALEQKDMQIYISDALAASLTRQSFSPAKAVYFFVVKKAGDVRPCIETETNPD